jgi:fatty acid desaturase
VEVGRLAASRREAEMGKAVAWALAMVAGVIVVGWVAVALLHALIGGLSYLIVGAVVIGGGVWLYGRAKRSLAPGTRAQRRIEAATKTYRMRNR